MKMKTYILLSILLLALFSCKDESISQNYQQYAVVKYNRKLPLDSFALKIKEYYQLPGLAITTIHGTQINEIAVLGTNKSKNGSPLNKESKFQIGSCSKSFTALLVASMIQDGLLNWDTKLEDIFTSFKIHKDFQETTVKQLLAHTSGLRQFWSDEAVFNIKIIIPGLNGSTIEKRKQFAEWNLSRKAPLKVGTHNYSNGGYVVVAAILEKLSGKSYEELMKERIFKPLNFKTPVFGYPFLNDSTQPFRHQYRDNNGNGIVLDQNTRLPDPIFNPAGFISLSIKDFANYVVFHKRALKGEEAIIRNKLIKDLFQPAHILKKDNHVGLGWMTIYVDGEKTYGHTGGDQTIRACMSLDVESGKALVFATNIGDERSEFAMINIIVELLSLHE